jgi:WD40 repeat protein
VFFSLPKLEREKNCVFPILSDKKFLMSEYPIIRKINVMGPSGQLSYLYRRPGDEIYAIDWSSDGQWIAHLATDGTMTIVQATSGREVSRWRVGKKRGTSLAWLPDSQHIITDSPFDDEVVILNASAGEKRILYKHGVEGSGDGEISVCLSPTRRLVASSAYEDDGPTVQVREAETGRRIATFSPLEPFDELQAEHMQAELPVYHPPFYPISWSPQGSYIAMGQDYKVHIWEPSTDQRVFLHSIANKRNSQEHIETFTWSPDEQCLVFAREEEIGAFANTKHVIDVWDWVTGERWSTYRGHTNVVRYMQWLAGKDQIVSVSRNELHLWDVHTGVCLARSVLPIEDEKDCTFSGAVLSPDCSQIALVGSRHLPGESEEGVLWVWRHGLEL